MKIADKLNNKKILIWGYGREGKSTEKFIRSHCEVERLDIFEGSREEINENEYDYIIKSPGIKSADLSERFTSQTQLFLEEFAPRVIGITGTKGKSTTSSMLYTVLSKCSGRPTLLVGNIGYPCMDYYDEIGQDTIVVFEMSCHQLSTVTVSPHVSVFLNLYEDHLDYYGTREKYFEAKKHIAWYQTEGDYYICGDTVPEVGTRAQKKEISYDSPQKFQMKLKGEHNQYNARFVYYICTELYGCEPAAVQAAIADFGGLPHRLEFVANVDGIDFYNDSISTIPEATIQAINSISNTKTVLIGGMDRHIHYEKIVDFIKAHNEYNYILSYESGKRIYAEVAGLECCSYVNDLEESVKLAKKLTPKGGACVLSPAAASYGYFKNFEERGEAYKALVMNNCEN